MANVRELTSRQRRLMISVFAGVAAACAAVVGAVSIPAHAEEANNFITPAFRSPTNIMSISVDGKGHTRWAAGDASGEIGSLEAPADLSVCYTYTEVNDGAFVAADTMYSFLGQVPGRQDPTRQASDTQRSNPRFLVGSTANVNTFSSSDCRSGLVKQFKALTISAGDPSGYLNIDLE